jgi:hypothetical protein
MARRADGTVLPGTVLNPHGRPRNNLEELKRQYSHRLLEFFEGLIELTKSSNENVRLQASRSVIEWLVGKPQIAVDMTHKTLNLGQLYVEALAEVNARARDTVDAEPR